MKDNTDQRCTVPWSKDDERICKTAKDINTTFWIGWNHITNQEKDCLAPCHSTLVNVGGKNVANLSDPTPSQIYLYFSARVTKSQEHYLYSFLTLIGRIGGYLGLYRIVIWFLDICRFDKLKVSQKYKTEDTLDEKACTTETN